MSGFLSCAAPTVVSLAPNGKPSCWPSELLGRTLWVERDAYVIYATTSESAQELNDWMTHEYPKGKFDCALNGEVKGVVFSLEHGPEPDARVEDWHKDNVRRERVIAWTSAIRNQRVRIDSGRPYSLRNRPYFRESFTICPKELRAMLPEGAKLPYTSWVCFLCCDQNVGLSASDEMQRAREAWPAERRKIPLIVRALSAPVTKLMEVSFYMWIYPEYRSIDLKLMRLQRRETRHEALLSSCVEGEAERTKRLAILQREIDDQWKYIWFRRPID